MIRHISRAPWRLAFVAAVAACSKSSNVSVDSAKSKPAAFSLNEEQRKRIHIVDVQPMVFRPVVEATGNVAFNGNRSTQVLSPVSGPAARVIGDVGMHVARG